MNVNLVTKNLGKLVAAQSAFSKYSIKLLPVEKEYPEIQASSSLEIAKFTALQAAKDLNSPAVREDHSLFLNAFNFPGPYTSYFEKSISAEILLKILSGFEDRGGFFEIATVYAEPNGSTKEFVYKVPIKIAFEEKGNLQLGWSRIIMLQGEGRTLAEYPEQDRLHVWSKNYEDIAKYINSLGSR